MKKLCYLIGFPVEHSLSAEMHNAAFKQEGLDFRYELRSVKPEDLEDFVNTTLRKPEVLGANVTIPYKISVISLLDEVKPQAARIGAVNTIVNEQGRLVGYNTDGSGALRALEEVYGDLYGAKAVVLGAGGAAWAISYVLSTVIQHITILNRTEIRAEKLVEAISGYRETVATMSARSLNRTNLKEALGNADILINATSVGMTPKPNESPVDRDLLRPCLLVFDIVYNPLNTILLKEAEEAGAKTLTGLNMLVYQGAEAFRLWTCIEAPEKLMVKVVEKALKEGKNEHSVVRFHGSREK